MELQMAKDKDCKHSVRFADEDGHNIYLKNAEVKDLGNPKAIKVTVEKSE